MHGSSSGAQMLGRYISALFLAKLLCLQGEVIDLDQVTLSGPSSAVDTPAEEQDFSLEDLVAAAEETHLSSLSVADIEAEFLEGEHLQQLQRQQLLV